MPETRPSPVIAAIDLGSNSIKMTVARSVEGDLQEIGWRSEAVRIGSGVSQSGRLADDRIASARDTLARFAAYARSLGAGEIIGVATEAVRNASNGPSFLEELQRDLGIHITTISGAREAELSFLGLVGFADLTGRVVIADIGGGSTEVIIASDGNLEWSRSYALGSGDLTERFVAHDPPLPGEIERCRQEATQMLVGVPWPRTSDRLYALGGTGEYLQRLSDPPITSDTVTAILQRLTAIPSADLAEWLTVPQARARVLPAGIAIAAAITDRVSPPEIRAAQSGIRRGLLREAFAIPDSHAH